MKTRLKKNELESSKACKIKQECLKELDTLIICAQAAIQNVTELKSVMETKHNQGSVLKAILQAKASNSIEVIYGRMGDLGAIDGKYDVAISTADPRLDYIVVETSAAAQACVDMLRNNNLGVATLMILQKEVDSAEKRGEVERYSIAFVPKNEIPSGQYGFRVAAKESSKVGPKPTKPIEIFEFEGCLY
ncbi:hypothetical protein L1987_42868 [Smallanthus sonchifolius]|uniref:Uncharacterized protein n=1 Tax=Smallanthus sonchifolius TaxID=185202 RepID=A0ACB9GK59_9ASTR|nr:hypothetical protein L1987_42868 [Smallanthus sonchifolius]